LHPELSRARSCSAQCPALSCCSARSSPCTFLPGSRAPVVCREL
jgi:hypothetical protein